MNTDKIILQGNYEKERGIHYEVDPTLPLLGIGGSGAVRKGLLVDEKNGMTRAVAIKFLFDDLNESAIERSRREASIHIVHENLVEMLGFIQVGQQDLYGKATYHYHVVSELLEGVMLTDMINGSFEEKSDSASPAVREFYQLFLEDRYAFAVKLIRSVLSGVLALHDNGFIHRDIDPNNIMITNEGKVKLIDLGIAKRMANLTTQDGHTQVGQFIGKAAYAAPEQVRGDVRSQNYTTDVYAIGIMFFQLVTGDLPFKGNMEEVIDQQINAKIPLKMIDDKGIRSIIKKATEKKQKDRYQSAAEFRVALEQLKRKSNPRPESIVDNSDSDDDPDEQYQLPMYVKIIIGIVASAIGVYVGILLSNL